MRVITKKDTDHESRAFIDGKIMYIVLGLEGHKKELQECVEMMRSHQDKKFRDELAKMKSELNNIEVES